MKTKSFLKTRCASVLIVILGSLALARSSDATPMLFTLTGVIFNDGKTTTGRSFVTLTEGNFGNFLARRCATSASMLS